MRTIALLYHDVVPAGHYELSGFQSPHANIYKMDCDEFRRHLKVIAAGSQPRPTTALDLLAQSPDERALLITVDDGGAGAALFMADILAEFGWKAHFFVTTNYIDTPGFVTADQILSLHRQGHIIGSHSASHPTRMSRCSVDQLDEEWSRSTRTLAGIIGEPVRVASIPGGYYSDAVAASAANAGIRVLFTSEPVTKPWSIGGCLMLGRFTVPRGVPQEWLLALVGGRIMTRLRCYAYWNLKKLPKALGGEHWLRFRAWVLARRNSEPE